MQSASAAATSAFGAKLGRLAAPPLVLELVSDLGGRKHTLVQGLAWGPGWGDRVTGTALTVHTS